MKEKSARKKFESGVLFLNQELFNEALEQFNQCILIDKTIAEAFSNRGIAYNGLREFEKAILDYKQAIKLNPNYAEAFCNLGVSLNHLRRFEEATQYFEQSIKIKPLLFTAFLNLGISLHQLFRFSDALKKYEVALRLNPTNPFIYQHMGLTYFALKNYDAAFVSYDKAITLNPKLIDTYVNAGLAFMALKNPKEALAIYDEALLVNKKSARIYVLKAEALKELKRDKEAIESLSSALLIEPNIDEGLGNFIHAKARICDWFDYDKLIDKLSDGIKKTLHLTQPLISLSLIGDPIVLQKCASIHTASSWPLHSQTKVFNKYNRHNKIRLGFYSSDFQEHPIAHLTSEFFERIDRSRFEVLAFSFGTAPNENPFKARLIKAFDEFNDVKDLNEMDIVDLSRKHEIDIAIDLNGYTGESRSGIFAKRVAPIQLHHLGFLGTMGAEFMDYIVADEILIPVDQQDNYTEKIIYLPCYQPNDSKRDISSKEMKRADFGLKENSFVFCCFNNTYKISPEIFNSWMQILTKAPDSLLWLIDNGEATCLNLKKEAQARGVNPDRIIFAKNIPIPEYLARFKLADLFLDTFPYNAGTVGSDALRMGLPLLTLCGNTFSSRMASSLLHAVSLAELITHSHDDYESLAVSIYKDRAKYNAIKSKLMKSLPESKLFDIDQFTRSIETAFTDIYERHLAGEIPQHLTVKN